MKALVTGGGGFLGMAICRLLVERGDSVRSFSRSEYPELRDLGVEQQQGDLADAVSVERAVAGCEVVFHVAAKAGAWGALREFWLANVAGTENVLDACRLHSVRHLVYTSTPSVVFDGEDMEGVNESVPYARRYKAHYPRTKAEAERMVLAANDARLQTVSLRPHLIWGPRDNQLVRRIIERGRAGRLRRIGTTPKLIDTVYVDDAAAAHLLAADRLRDSAAPAISGKVYFISAGQPIELWKMVDLILGAAQLAPVSKTISPRAAYSLGFVLEMLYGLLRLRGEPLMTRWVARELATAHWFDISAARRDLGYEPQVSLEEGLRRLAIHLSV